MWEVSFKSKIDMYGHDGKQNTIIPPPKEKQMHGFLPPFPPRFFFTVLFRVPTSEWLSGICIGHHTRDCY